MTTLAERIGGAKRVVGGPFGSKLTSADYTLNGVPVIRGSNMEQNGRWIGGEFAFVSSEKVISDLSSNLAGRGDIIVTQRGTMGQVSIVPDDAAAERFVISQSQMAISVDPNCASRDFVYYYLRSPKFADYLDQSIIQVGVPHINLSILRQSPADWPALEVQEEIANQLAAFDDKIELIRRMNETLEAMAQAIFRDWFVDFGPVHRKLAGATDPVEIMGGVTADGVRAAELAALFPDALGGDGVPVGWRLAALKDHIQNFDSKRVPVSGTERAKRAGSYPYYGAASVMGSIDDYLFDGVFLLVGEDGSVVRPGGLAVTQYVWGKFWVNNHAHVLQGAGPVSTEQLLLYFNQEPVEPYVTGAVQMKLSQGRMGTMPFVFAGQEICEAFGKIVAPLYSRVRAAADEGRTLAETRDYLLPRLMSGEVRVGDVAQEIAA